MPDQKEHEFKLKYINRSFENNNLNKKIALLSVMGVI